MPALINHAKQSDDGNTFSNIGPPNRPLVAFRDCLRNRRHDSSIFPKISSNDTEMRRNWGANPTRTIAVPVSLQNKNADLIASSPSKQSSRSFSDSNMNSSDIHTCRKRNAPGAMPENTRCFTTKHSRSQEASKNQAFNEQEQNDFYHDHNAPLQPPIKTHQRALSPQNRSKIDNLKQKKKYQHEQHYNIEHDSSYVCVRNLPPPLWTEGFAKEVTNSVQRTLDDIISRGRLQHTPPRKIWSSLTPQDILRSTSYGNEHEEEEDNVLGSGSFSKVSKVCIKGNSNCNKSNSLFALKRLKGDLLPLKLTDQSCKNGSVKAFTKAATELAREAFLLSRLDHPNIINIIGWTQNNVASYSTYRRHDAYFLVLELLQEETLDDRIDGWNQNDMNLQETSYMQHELKSHLQRRKIEQLTICKQIASALAYIHSRNVVYRDLKPQNIGFARAAQDSEDDVVVKLMDFGLARELPSNGILPPYSTNSSQQRIFRSHPFKNNSSSLFDMTGTVGTIRYMAPEVCLNRPYGLKCDVYSWSIVSHEILTQMKPYDNMTPDMYQSAVCQQGVRPPTQNMPSEHAVLLTQAWRSDPSMRLPLHRILRQLDLLIKREKLVWEAQELLSGMPEKSESLPQSYSYESTSTRLGSQEEGRQIKKQRWYRNDNNESLLNGHSVENHIFPNASMDYQSENPWTSQYNRYCNLNHPRNSVMHEQSAQPQSYFATPKMSFSSELPQPMTPDRHHRQQIQQQVVTPDSEFNNKCNGYHNNNYFGAETRGGDLSPSHDFYGQRNYGYR